MYIRRVKRKCNVRACKCTNSFSISQTREAGNTVIICENCLRDALFAIGEIDPRAKSNIPKEDKTPPPALFFNTKALGITAESKADDAQINLETDDNESSEDVTKFACPDCGKEFDSEKGLKTHMRHCQKQESEGAEAE